MSKTVSFSEPFDLFESWYGDAMQSEPDLPEAVAVATTTSSGYPSVRMVLLKDYSDKGYVFYTNFDSRKGKDLIDNPNAALLFHWKSLQRQIRIEGKVEIVTEQEADAYFSGRPRASRIGAWASRQSEVLEGRFEFEAEIAKYTAKFGLGDIPRPPNWSGFRVIPDSFEFWQDRQFRLHDRQHFIITDNRENWVRQTLFP